MTNQTMSKRRQEAMRKMQSSKVSGHTFSQVHSFRLNLRIQLHHVDSKGAEPQSSLSLPCQVCHCTHWDQPAQRNDAPHVVWYQERRYLASSFSKWPCTCTNNQYKLLAANVGGCNSRPLNRADFLLASTLAGTHKAGLRDKCTGN